MHNPRDLNLFYSLLHQHRLSAPDLDVAVKAELKHLNAEEAEQMRLYLREVRNEIEDYFADLVDPLQLHKIPEAELKDWLKAGYPWMDEQTLTQAYKDGLHFAAK